MVNVGIAGIGFMGVTHFKAYAAIDRARVAAICTRNPKKLEGDWSDVKGNFGEGGGVQDLAGVAKHHDFGELIRDETLDMVDICLPTPQHADRAVAALEAGKHVMVEKPIALTVADADRMIAAAKGSGRLLMVGQVLRFWPQFVYLKRLCESGEFGKLAALNLTRITAPYDWSASVADMAANGGPLIDLHIHDADYVLHLLGRPVRVHAVGREAGGCVVYVGANYVYDGDAPAVSCQSGAAAMGRPFLHGFDACFETATVCFSEATEPDGVDPAQHQSATQVLTVYHHGGKVSFPELPDQDAFEAQLAHVIDCVAANRPSPIISGASGRDALALVLLEGESIRTGEAVDTTTLSAAGRS